MRHSRDSRYDRIFQSLEFQRRIIVGLVFLGTVALGFGLAGCVGKVPEPTREAYEVSLERWIGLPSDDLKREWGLPTRTDSLNNGNTLLEYKRLKSLGLRRDTCTTVFEVNQAGFIIAHRSYGAACRAAPGSSGS